MIFSNFDWYSWCCTRILHHQIYKLEYSPHAESISQARNLWHAAKSNIFETRWKRIWINKKTSTPPAFDHQWRSCHSHKRGYCSNKFLNGINNDFNEALFDFEKLESNLTIWWETLSRLVSIYGIQIDPNIFIWSKPNKQLNLKNYLNVGEGLTYSSSGHLHPHQRGRRRAPPGSDCEVS